MKALTISEPWASLIASGEKWIENRTWETSYRGPLVIHSGKGIQYMTRKELDRDYPNSGCVLATCDLVTCVNLECPSVKSTAELQSVGLSVLDIRGHKHTEGPVAWVLSGIRKVAEPFPMKGRQGLWQMTREELAANVDKLAF